MENINNISSRQNQQNILFYMENCKTCNVFISMAQKANILRLFKIICIDGKKDMFIAQGLKKVPTIIIPSINKQFEGNDCLRWLEDMIRLSSNKNVYPNQNEMYVPDIGLIIPTQPNIPTQQNIPIIPTPPIISNTSGKMNKNKFNEQMSQLSNQINQLSTQLNSQVKEPVEISKSNQFEVPKTNLVKRGTLNVVQPPPTTNLKQRQLNSNPNQFNANGNNQNLINNNGTNGPVVRQVNQLFGFLDSEMSGFSDGYAYISIDNPLPKSFLPPDKDMEIYTAPEGDKIDRRKQDELIKTFEMERINERNKFSQAIQELNNRVAMGDINAIPKWLGSNPDL